VAQSSDGPQGSFAVSGTPNIKTLLSSFFHCRIVVISPKETISNPKKTGGLDEYCPIPLTSPGAQQQQQQRQKKKETAGS
jgi:hypothetical protein